MKLLTKTKLTESEKDKTSVKPSNNIPKSKSNFGVGLKSKFFRILIIIVVILDVIIVVALFGRGVFKKTANVQPDLAAENELSLEEEAINTNIAETNTNSETNANAETNTNIEAVNVNSVTNVNEAVNTNTNSSQNNLYTSSGLGLTLDLKKPFQLASGFSPEDDFFQATTYEVPEVAQVNTEVTGLKIEIIVQENLDQLDLMEWIVQQGIYDEEEITLKNTTVGRKSALSRETLTDFDAQKSIYVSAGDKVYIIYVSGDRDSYDTYTSVAQAIVNSITFL